MILSLFNLIAAPINLGTFDPSTDAYSKDAAEISGKTAAGHLELLVSNIIGLMTVLAGLFFVIYFVIAAFQWVTSGGDSGKLSSARNRMLHGILGMVVIVAAYGILGIIGKLLGLDILTPGKLLLQLDPTP